MKGIQLNLALESGRQGLDHGFTKTRFGAVNHNAQHGECHQAQKSNSGDPSPAAAPRLPGERIWFAFCHPKIDSTKTGCTRRGGTAPPASSRTYPATADSDRPRLASDRHTCL